MAIIQEREMRRNVIALLQYLAVLGIVIVVFTIVFHMLMLYEKQDHSWLTGLYWTLTVMSTLGFGDITFHTDLGRAFSIIVLLTGILMLLIVLPFAFIRYFYAPWLDAQLRHKAPRELPEDTRDHVVICDLDPVGEALVEHLIIQEIPYVVIDPDPTRATARHGEGIRVVVGELDSVDTWRAVRAENARLLVMNRDDATNTNSIITASEVVPQSTIAAFADAIDAVDILELSGASHVIPLKQLLGEQLAARVSVGSVGVHEIGVFDGIDIAEFPIRKTRLVGKQIKDVGLRKLTGLNIIGYWERGKLLPPRPDVILSDYTVLVVAGTVAQLDELRAMLSIYNDTDSAVVVLGGGNIGQAVIRALKKRDIIVHVIEQNPDLEPTLSKLADRVVIGDAACIDVMDEVDIRSAPSIVLTTRNDATNIYLAVYSRRLNPDAFIVSRIMHDRNLEAIHRAGANTVLGESTLGAKAILGLLEQRQLVFIGEEIEIFVVDVPQSLVGQTLAESALGATTGMNVIGVRTHDQTTTTVQPTTLLESESAIVMLGTFEQRQQFTRQFETPE